MSVLLCRFAILLYLAATLFYIFSLLKRRVHPAKYATWTMAAAFAAHSVFMVFIWKDRGYTPVITIPDVLSFFAWSITGAYLLVQFRTKTRVLGISIAPVSLLLLLWASPGISGIVQVPPILKSSLVYLHVSLSLMGEAFYTLATLAGVVYLIQDGLLKRKTSQSYIRYLPPLKDLDGINEWSLVWGFICLTLGIIAGMFNARVTWTGAWHLDAKFIWSWGAWVFFAILVHQRLAIGWTGRRPAILTCLFFFLLMGTFILELSLFPSLHRFF